VPTALCATALCHNGGEVTATGTWNLPRGQVHWLKVRTAAALSNHLSAFWRSTLRTTSERATLVAARVVCAALDMGFRAVEAGMHSGTMSKEEAGVVIAAIGRRALTIAESLRARVAKAEAW
jgi:hypothetical protein